MANPTLGFPSKKEALAHTRAIRDRYKALELERDSDGSHIPLTGRDAEFITALLRNHPSAAEKIGPGIDHHYVAPDDTGSENGWGFRTVRIDGSEVAWSLHNALSGKHRPAEQQVKIALRNEVEHWCQDAGAEYDADTLFGGVCWRTGEPIIDKHDSELHHDGAWPFWRIVREFMLDERLGWENIKVENDRVGGRELVGIFRLADRELASRFVEFHAEHAQIVRVLKHAHKLETKEEAQRRRGSYYGKLEFPDDPFEGEVA